MATVHLTISRVSNSADGGETMPVLASVPERAETISSGADSKKSTIAVPDQRRSLYWTIAPLEPVWVRFGTDPTAVAGEGYLVPAGAPMNFTAEVGHRCAVKTAS